MAVIRILVYSVLVVTAIRDTVPRSTGDTGADDSWLDAVYCTAYCWAVIRVTVSWLCCAVTVYSVRLKVLTVLVMALSPLIIYVRKESWKLHHGVFVYICVKP